MSADSCSTVHHVVFYSVVVSKQTSLEAYSSPNALALKALFEHHPASPLPPLAVQLTLQGPPTRLMCWFRASKSLRGLKNIFFLSFWNKSLCILFGFNVCYTQCCQSFQSKRSEMILRLCNGSFESIMSCNYELLFDEWVNLCAGNRLFHQNLINSTFSRL